MSNARDIVDQLRHTDGALARLRSLSTAKDDEVAEINLGALEKRRRDLMEKLERLQSAEQFDIVDYRIEATAGGIFPITAVGQSLQRFQEVITAIFDAIRTAPKRKYAVSADNAQLSTLNFATAHQGSLGLSFTIPNDRLLGIESELDTAVHLAFEVLNASSSATLRDIADRVGVAPISRAYMWAEVHSKYGFDAKISWSKSAEKRERCEIAAEKASRLKDIIRETGDAEVARIEISGLLRGLDVDRSFFHLLPPEGEDIVGILHKDFKHQDQWVINDQYVAIVNREVVLKYATGEEKISWTLVSLAKSK